MIDLLSGRPGQLLAETLLHFLWQGAALALLLKLADPLLRSVQDRYAASLGVLVVMLALPVATCVLLAQREPARTMIAQPYAASTQTLAAESIGLAAPQTLSSWQPLLTRWQPLFVGLWLIGVLLLAARLLVGYAATVWLRGGRQPLPAQLAGKVAWLGRRMGVATRCRVFLSTRIDEAIAVGCFKPLVLVPLAWVNELPPSALEAVIAHELAHIRRWDLWATLLQRLAETLLFYHPAVWWLSRRMSLQRELCCDAEAVRATQRPAEYALALETIARRTSAPPLSLATSFLGGGNMNLLQRVQSVLAGGPPREASSWWPAGLAALAAPALAAVVLGGWSLLPATVVADDDELRQAIDRKIEAENSDAEALGPSYLRSLKLVEIPAAQEAEVFLEEPSAEKRQQLIVRWLAAVDRELEERKEKPARTKDSRAAAEELDLGKFRPETEREERLLAVIKKLQAQIKKAPAEVKKRPTKGGLDEIVVDTQVKKRPLKGELPAEAKKRPTKEDIHRKHEKAALSAESEHKKALTEKEAAAAKIRHVKVRPAKELDGEILKDYEALLRDKEIRFREHDPNEIQKKRDKEKLTDKEAALRHAKERKAAAEQEGYARKLDEAQIRKAHEAQAHELEALRRALREREAQLKKAAQALERRARELGEKDGSERQEGERKDGEREENEDRERRDGER